MIWLIFKSNTAERKTRLSASVPPDVKIISDGLTLKKDAIFFLHFSKIDFEDLEKRGEFYLPKDYDDVQVILEYFEDIEDYETCILIRDKQLWKVKKK